jgi:unsaturated rhamnogalacturonyl hydrolase
VPTPGTGLDAQQRLVLSALLGLQRQSWEQGLLGSALLDLAAVDPALRQLAEVVAADCVSRQLADGRLAELQATSAVNGAAAAEVVMRAAGNEPDDPYRIAFAAQLRWLTGSCPRAADGTLFHRTDRPEVWADTVYMALPALVLADLSDLATRQLAGHRRRLFDSGTGRYAARYAENTAVLVDTRHWGTASGWVVAGIARALQLLRYEQPGATEFAEAAAEHARQVLDGCLACRRPDGLFGDVLDDPASFAEANLGQLLGYAMFTGLADGWLPRRYAEPATALVTVARRQLDELGLVRPVAGSPTFDRPGFSAEAQAFFLLATAAERRWQSTLPAG